MWKSVSLCLSVLISANEICHSAQPSRSQGFILNADRPYLDIIFSHTGKRKPVFAGESAEGLWLRLRNNCIYTVRVRALNVPNVNRGELLVHEILKAPGPIPVPPNVAAIRRLTAPVGYTSGSHIVNWIELRPSKELLFSVPLEHVTREWSMRVEIEMLLPTPKSGRQPRTFVEVFYDDLSPEAQTLSDLLLEGRPAR